MTIDYDNGSTVRADFVIADLATVREAIAHGAVRINSEPAAEVLARLETEAMPGFGIGQL